MAKRNFFASRDKAIKEQKERDKIARSKGEKTEQEIDNIVGGRRRRIATSGSWKEVERRIAIETIQKIEKKRIEAFNREERERQASALKAFEEKQKKQQEYDDALTKALWEFGNKKGPCGAK